MTGIANSVIVDQILINDGKKESEASAAVDVALHGKRRAYSRTPVKGTSRLYPCREAIA